MIYAQDYQQLLATLDTEVTRIGKMHVAAISCGPGCISCCLAFSVLPIEAACLRDAIAALPSTRQEQLGQKNLTKGGERCPLLIDDLCSIYVARPVICRTQGLPLAYVDEERQTIEVSACPLNFPADYIFVPEKLLFLDQFNTRLAELNRAWCHIQGLPPDQRIPLREIVCPFPPGA
ncbi:MAG: YkgJ family cysteine cluster protein [Desulfurivibrionaceae bacterium]